jgi:V-type H+-transporting ATPase subunit d
MTAYGESPGSFLSYATSDGYIDGYLRGLQLGLLSRSDYETLTQCDSLDDMKLHLQTTNYGDFLASEPSPLHTTTIAEKCTSRLVDEFEYLKTNATGSLSKFLDYITYGYMIDNIVLLITGSLHKRDISELLEKCHPLGLFETMESIVAGQNVSELYNEVLIDTPLGPYIVNNLSEADLDEMNVEQIRNTLYKAYLEDFDEFCSESLGGITGMVMHEILSFEADRRSINITLNSLDTELTQDNRAKLYPKLGQLFPEGRNKLMVADKPEDVKHAVDHVETYKKIFSEIEGKEDKSLEDLFFEFEVSLNLRSFEQMFQYGIFFSYVKLKEQEIRNIVWIAECILQNHRSEIDHYILPSWR